MISRQVLEIYGPVEMFEPINLLGVDKFGYEVIYQQQHSLCKKKSKIST